MKQYIEYPDIKPLLKLFMRSQDNAVGGNLHIFLEDGNVADDHIKFCLEQCVIKEDLLGESICRLALKMSTTQRLKISRDIYDV